MPDIQTSTYGRPPLEFRIGVALWRGFEVAIDHNGY